MPSCHLCGRPTTAEAASQAGWLDERVVRRIARAHPTWRLADGACPACVQEAVLEDLLVHGRAALAGRVQAVWPLDAAAAFGALPTPLRMRADPRFTGTGTTIALVDAGFFPHPDLVRPINRVRAWADATGESVAYRSFAAEDVPAWPEMRLGDSAGRWHGLMTSVTAAGNGYLSHGLYRGIAPESSVVLVQVGTARGITNAAITRALSWILEQRDAFDIGVVSLSIGGDDFHEDATDVIDGAVSRLVEKGVSVVAAAGNDGVRRLVPPATAAAAITVGGLDDGNVLAPEARQLWHSNYGETRCRVPKPEVVAPSIWTVAPVLSGTDVALEAQRLFAARAAARTSAVDGRIAELRLVTPHYQHVDGTSFAAPLVAATIACMRQANPGLTPARLKELLMRSATPIDGVPIERQGAGAIDTGLAVALALGAAHGLVRSVPILDERTVRFVLHDGTARSVSVLGSWDDWRLPGARAARRTAAVWEASLTRPARSGPYSYKFLIDGERWLPDPANPLRTVSDEGHVNSVVHL